MHVTGDATWLVTRTRGQLRIAHGAGGHVPQYAALHLRDSYFRLNYGPGAGWGTSIVLLPVYWCDGLCHHGARVSATWDEVGRDLVLSLGGRIGDLDVSLRVSLSPPGRELVVARVEAACAGRPRLDARAGEAFKPVMLSSMRISPTLWDAGSAFVDEERLPIPTSGWLRPPPFPRARALGLRGGTSAWKRNATTIRVEFDRPITVAGWVTPSADPNDDNVGLWAASDAPLERWSYRIVATP